MGSSPLNQNNPLSDQKALDKINQSMDEEYIGMITDFKKKMLHNFTENMKEALAYFNNRNTKICKLLEKINKDKEYIEKEKE